jgi:hypothetical protein
VRTFVGARPGLYFPMQWLRGGTHRERLVDGATNLCVEGFPRSANSFAVGAIEAAQDASINIAHHAHVPAPAMRACRLGIPTLILIRDPVEAVISLRGLSYQTDRRAGRPLRDDVPFASKLEAWMTFYDCLAPFRDQFVVAPFEVVVRDMGAVIKALNAAFGLTLTPFDHTESNVQALREQYGYHALPSDERAALKQRARHEFEAEVEGDSSIVSSARARHERWVTSSVLSHLAPA